MTMVSPESIAAVTGFTACSSHSMVDATPKRTIWFEFASDDDLRLVCDWHAQGITRAQLLAACRNRYPCGFYYEIDMPVQTVDEAVRASFERSPVPLTGN